MRWTTIFCQSLLWLVRFGSLRHAIASANAPSPVKQRRLISSKAIGKYPLSPTLCQLSRRRCRHQATTTPTTTTNPTNTAPRAQANTGEK